MELPCWLFFLLNCDVEVVKSFVEIVELIIEQTPEEVETSLLLLLAAAFDSEVKELLSLVDFLDFGAVVNVLIRHWIGVASYNANNIEAEWIFILRKSHASLVEVLTSH